VLSFCSKLGFPSPNIDGIFVVGGRSQRKTSQIKNLYDYRVDIFYTVIDMQLHDLNNCFSKVNTELLLCMASLNPSNLFCTFYK
jgi:hypothetical protein